MRVARDLGDDLATDALDRDRAGKPPYDEVARLRDSGLQAALVPPGTAAGGTEAGMDWEDACAIVRRIAAADGSMGELLGRHHVLSWSARFFAAPDRVGELEARAVRERWLWAGDTGATGADGASRPRDDGACLLLTRTAGGLRLNGVRTLPTAVDVADRLVLDAFCTGTGESRVVLVDPHHPGVGRVPLSDRLGQRLAGAGTVRFDDVPIGVDDVLGTAAHDEYAVAPFAAVAPLALRLMLTHVVLGVAQGALAEARDLSRVASHARPGGGGEGLLAPPPGADADLLLTVGELVLAVHSASAVTGHATSALAETLRAGRAPDAEQLADTAALVAAAEAVTVKAALSIGERVLDITGAEGLDRFWRNIRVLADRGPAGPALRAIGDHFLHCDAATSARWT
ncbi:acyl-CoA dehydrogenase [Streptomyces nitrosporeus]|uniref:Acyl-CoA dehydrogenase n=1 Tax=Streptomyces nitrosporeus TaxID=28894 RepID=A0A5J6F3V0_9ACTN|nr:acyl-CoA dehydrogenase [Streptomyces nitrosporeus]QEU70871.1 acyl-CoA dehydrogenase [Streptomyces nitrosporeus]